MTRTELQQALKTLRDAGHAVLVKLNAKTEDLRAEYIRINETIELLEPGKPAEIEPEITDTELDSFDAAVDAVVTMFEFCDVDAENPIVNQWNFSDPAIIGLMICAALTIIWHYIKLLIQIAYTSLLPRILTCYMNAKVLYSQCVYGL